MRMAADVAVDSLSFVSRSDLDNIQLSCRFFRDIVATKLSHKSLRLVERATLRGAASDTGMYGAYIDLPDGNEFAQEGSLTEVIEWFTRHLSSSYVDFDLSFDSLSSADLAALPLNGFTTVFADRIALGRCDFLGLSNDELTNFLFW